MVPGSTQNEAPTLSADVVEAIATATGADPLTMTPPLQTVVDVEALETLCRTEDSVEVHFDYDGHAVVVEGTGAVSVDGAVHDGEG